MFFGMICGISLVRSLPIFQTPLEIDGASCYNKVIYGRFHDYTMLRGGTMKDQEKRSLIEAKRVEKRAAEEAQDQKTSVRVS